MEELKKRKKVIAIFIITSPLFHKDYQPSINDYSSYIKRKIE